MLFPFAIPLLLFAQLDKSSHPIADTGGCRGMENIPNVHLLHNQPASKVMDGSDGSGENCYLKEKKILLYAWYLDQA